MRPLKPVSDKEFPYANITTAIFNCTTVENPAFRVKGGQKVQIFLIRLNSNIPTNIIAPSDIDKWKVPMAQMTRYIATEPVLADRLRAFVAE